MTLERDRPDIVISADDLPDMSGVDLLEIMRDDEELSRVGFVLLSDAPPEEVDVFYGNLVLGTEASPKEVVQASYRLLLTITRLTQADATPHPAKRPTRGSISGTLEVFNLLELIQSLKESRKTGKLFVQTDGAEAQIFFLEGKIIHAEFDTLIGEEAIFYTMFETEGRRETEFVFEPYEAQRLAPAFSSINKPTDRLMLDLTVKLDHTRQHKAQQG